MSNEDCLFCRIVSGDIPAAKVFEDDACVAFVDIGPVAHGHTLLIPKNHYATLREMSEQDAAATLRNLPRLARAVQDATGCEGVNILQNNGRVAGQTIGHVHFHIIPRNPNDAFQFNWPAGKYPQGRLEELADAIRLGLAQ